MSDLETGAYAVQIRELARNIPKRYSGYRRAVVSMETREWKRLMKWLDELVAVADGAAERGQVA